MRVLLDENVPVGLAPELTGHEVETVSGLGWSGAKNSELLRRASGQFDVLVTMDQNLPFQQNLTTTTEPDNYHARGGTRPGTFEPADSRPPTGARHPGGDG